MALPSGMDAPHLYNDHQYVALEPGLFDHGEVDHLPEWMRKMIMGSPEYDAIMNPKPKRTAPLAEVLDIPF
jgi:hypothetical protein